MAPSHPASIFDVCAAEYDLPTHELFYRRIADELLEMMPSGFSPRSILEIGAGTGFATAALRESFPEGNITALEPSAAMLARGVLRIPAAGWINRPLEEWTQKTRCQPAGVFDLVVSSMSYHWLNQAERRHLFELATDGVLALALPVCGGPVLPGNKAVKKLLLLGRRPFFAPSPWPRQARQTETVASHLKARFCFVDSCAMDITENYRCMEDMARSLYVRGSLHALFGNGAAQAMEMLSQCYIGNISINWAIRLFVATNRRGWPHR